MSCINLPNIPLQTYVRIYLSLIKGADEIDETDEDEISNETLFDDDDEEYATDEDNDYDFDGNNDESSYYQEDDIEGISYHFKCFFILFSLKT